MRPEKNRAFSFVEVMIVLLWVGILAAIAVPRLNFAIITRQRADNITRKVVTDLRLTRRLAISDAANNTFGFQLKMVGASPYTSYEIVDCSPPLTTVDSHTLDPGVTITCPTGITFAFGPLGNLDPGSADEMEINISAEGRSFAITILKATGAVKCTEN